jgi:hypothetical protein
MASNTRGPLSPLSDVDDGQAVDPVPVIPSPRPHAMAVRGRTYVRLARRRARIVNTADAQTLSLAAVRTKSRRRASTPDTQTVCTTGKRTNPSLDRARRHRSRIDVVALALRYAGRQVPRDVPPVRWPGNPALLGRLLGPALNGCAGHAGRGR